MAIKKNELYSSLWASCDKLRGGMDASQYKDYILTLLFVKYVTDKFQGVKYADITVPEGGSFNDLVRFLYKGIIIKHNKTEPTYTKTSLFLCEKRRFFMARTEKGVVTTI